MMLRRIALVVLALVLAGLGALAWSVSLKGLMIDLRPLLRR